MTPGDADIPGSIARALLYALQEKRMGNQLPAAMGPLARVRASQLQQCLAKGSEPTEAVIQATLDLIAVDQGPANPLALANTVSMASQTPDVQLNATVPAQDSSSSFNTPARAEVADGFLYTTIADNSSTGFRPNDIGRTQHQANSFQMFMATIKARFFSRSISDFYDLSSGVFRVRRGLACLRVEMSPIFFCLKTKQYAYQMPIIQNWGVLL